ncbi:SCO2524 family protein [Actinosynnema sp. NPDC020468]|uniref:SCO2524 family protein n=1 Tax=Actinosynnema sp. NPDC020468 TaxID=3154488 RepID=UPI0033D2F571
MRIQPRRMLLDVWRALAKSAYRDGVWHPEGHSSDSVSGASLLLCLLRPATELPALALDTPDVMADDVAQALGRLGEPRTIPFRLVEVIEEFLERHVQDGEPVFDGWTLLVAADGTTPTPEQCELGLVDSYARSVGLCLSALGFLSAYRPQVARRPALVHRIERVQDSLRARLTAALVGLLRSFVVHIADPGSAAHEAMIATVRRPDESSTVAVARLADRLHRVRTRLLEDVRVGLSESLDLDDSGRLFEIGWTWGISSGAAPIEVDNPQIGRQPVIGSVPGVAEPRPQLYATLLVLDCVEDLHSTRTRALGLLDDEQRQLAEALRIRQDLTLRYWSAVARSGTPWPLEDLPWRTSDGDESDFATLLVTGAVIRDLELRRTTDEDVEPVAGVLEALAGRGRITRRVTRDDQAAAVLPPGVRLPLPGAEELGPPLHRHTVDFAPLLLRWCLVAGHLSTGRPTRDRLARLAETVMDHLSRRRIGEGDPAGLWDDPGGVPGVAAGSAALSWATTERVVEALVVAARAYADRPLSSAVLGAHAEEALHEAEHLLNRMLLRADSDDTSARSHAITAVERRLGRAREVLAERPATASALAHEALLSLDELAVAEQDASRGVR